MNLKYLITLIFIVFLSNCTFVAFGQTQKVTGIVTSTDDKQPIPGATIFIPATGGGTITNIDGFFSIDIPLNADSIEFRFIGMETQKVAINGLSQINITLSPELYTVDEVVVTALGISRDAKSLGYSVTAINSDELSNGANRSVLNALQGKVAGVNISSASGAPGSSTRILMRGVSSLTGSNQPLVVVNGVPVNNTPSGSSSINGGTDFGNKLNDINPDDIESISILKGTAGTVLYGSRAANGVIIITTKTGKLNAKPQISISSTVGFERPLHLVEYQNEYGQGIYGDHVLYENTSWGPKFDNKFRPWGHNVDNSLRVKAYRPLPENVDEFFETGINYTNTFSIDGGTDRTTYFFSYSHIKSDGIFPADADTYGKHSISLSASQQVTKRFKTSTSLNFIHKTNSYVPTGQGEQSVYNQIMQTPRDISLLEISDIDDKWNTIDNHYSLYTVNPYQILKNNGNENREDRIMGTFDFSYSILKNLTALWRLGGDISNDQIKAWREKIVPLGNNEFASVFDPGSVGRSASNQTQINSDLVVTYSIEKENWTLQCMGGQSINQRSSTGLSASVQNLSIPGFPNLSNSSERASAGEGNALRRSMGLYGSFDFSLKSLLFLSVNMRNDWSSTLPPQNNSYFYPGANVGLLISELFPTIKKVLPYGKIRASWAQVGNDAPPYMINPVFVKAGHSDGFGFLSYPLASGVNSYDVGDLIANYNLKPELTREYELGVDFRFFNNRFSIDMAYYHKTTTDLIWASPVPYSSGYSNQMQNLGKLSNYGVEALLGIVPIRKSNFRWEVTLNYTRNYNQLDYLNNELEKAELNALRVDGGQQISWVAIPGKPVGVFMGRAPKYTSDGKMVVDNQGLPIADEELKMYGDSQYKYFGGLTNQFTYKNFTCSFMFDFRKGGIMYSRTKDITNWAGSVEATLYNDRQPFIIPNAVVEVGRDSKGEPIYQENSKPIDRVNLVNFWGNGGFEIDGNSLMDKSFVKLRELIFSYDLPVSWLQKVSIGKASISVVGKNLLLWTPAGQTYIDPELTTFGNDLTADFGEYGAQPSTRSIAINLRVTF